MCVESNLVCKLVFFVKFMERACGLVVRLGVEERDLSFRFILEEEELLLFFCVY